MPIQLSGAPNKFCRWAAVFSVSQRVVLDQRAMDVDVDVDVDVLCVCCAHAVDVLCVCAVRVLDLRVYDCCA